MAVIFRSGSYCQNETAILERWVAISESSTAYHRISTEMMLYATALILGLPKNKKEALANYDHKRWKKHPKLKGKNIRNGM